MDINVLVIDNNLLMCRTWGAILKAYGYHTVETTRIETIPEIAERFPIDVVIAGAIFSRSHGESLRG